MSESEVTDAGGVLPPEPKSETVKAMESALPAEPAPLAPV
jgi:hypothetical protein